MSLRTALLSFLVLCTTMACSTNNRKSKEAALQASLVMQAQADYVVRNGLIDPKALATDPDGTFHKDVCVEHSKMLETFRQGTPALAAALKAWANDEDVQELELEEVDHEARCAP